MGWRVYQFVNLSIFWWVLWGGRYLERVFCGGCLIRRDVREERGGIWKMREIGGVWGGWYSLEMRSEGAGEDMWGSYHN